MQEFFIKKDSMNPLLEMELCKDGRYDFQKSLINEALQDSVVTFTMVNEETGTYKVSNAPANIVLSSEGGCEERYILQYEWKKRDINEIGFFKGWFEITFNGDIVSEGKQYPKNNLIVPIEEDLRIVVR